MPEESLNAPKPTSADGVAARYAAGIWRERISAARCLLFDRVPVTVAVSLAVFGLQAIHSILLARLLGPTGRGEYGTAIFYAQTMIYIGLLGTHYSIARITAEQKHSPAAMQRVAFRVGLITGTLSLMIAMLLNLTGLPESKSYLLPLCLVCTLLLPAEHLRLTAQAVDHGRGAFGRYNWSRLFAASIFPAIVLGLYFAHVNQLAVIAWCTVVVSVIGYAFYWIISDTKQVWRPSSASARFVLRDGVSDGALVIANDMYDRLAVLLVLWLVSLEGQGHYLTALPAASLLLVAPNALELFAFRAAANVNNNLTLTKCLQATALVVLVQMCVLVALQLVLGPLFLFLFGSDFLPSVPVARVLIVALAFNGLTIVGEGYLRGRKLARLGIITRVVAVLFMLASAAWFTWMTPTIRIAACVLVGHAANALLVGLVLFRDVASRASQEPVA